MKIAILASNYSTINRNVCRGPEIFIYTYLTHLVKKVKSDKLQITTFASGNSVLPTKIESVNYLSSIEDKDIGTTASYHKILEMMLFSKAFFMQDKFDLFHANTGDEKVILPLALFVKKPILITLHSPLDLPGVKKIYKLLPPLKNVFFISISNAQRKPVPYLNYLQTIYHGLDMQEFTFNKAGGNIILWIGRGNPEKGIDMGLNVVNKLNREAEFYIAVRDKYKDWLKSLLQQKSEKAQINFESTRDLIISKYQQAKLFLFPIQWEEPFGLVMIESMACGTPIVAFARGSVPEVIKDGETGFIVNSSPDDIRGNWIVKKTGFDGLCEAVEKIYSMPDDQYRRMRHACREHVEKNFTVERMVDEYEKVYQQILSK